MKVLKRALSAASGGAGGVARAGVNAAVVNPARRVADDLGARFTSSARGGFEASGGSLPSAAVHANVEGAATAERGSPPAWARRMQRGQSVDRGISTAAHAIKSGDGGGAGASVDLSELT